MYRTFIVIWAMSIVQIAAFSAAGSFLWSPPLGTGGATQSSFRGGFSFRVGSRSRTEEPQDDSSLIEPSIEQVEAFWHIHEPPEFERAVLQQKLSALHLSDQKLLVLQDAAQRMVRRHETELHDTRAQHATALAAKEQTASQRHAAELERMRLAGEQRERKLEAAGQAERLRLNEHFQKQMENAHKEHAARIEALQDAHTQDRTAWSEQESELRLALAVAEKTNIQQLRHANGTIQAMQVEMNDERERYERLKQEFKAITERYERLKSRWNQLRRQNEALVAQQQSVEQKTAEQVEIATAAVAAATQREQDLQENDDALLLRYNTARQQSQQEVSTISQLNRASEVPVSLADREHDPRGLLDVVWNARAVRFVRRWIRYIFVPRAPVSFRRRSSSSSNDT
jgi:FtsZ-binding cell division protein ZapB